MAKKTNARKSPKPTAKKAVKKADAGYRGHRKGTIKEKLHLIFDQTKKNPEKARELAMKLMSHPGLSPPASPNSETPTNDRSSHRLSKTRGYRPRAPGSGK